MLILSRKKGESIIIDGKIEVSVLDVSGDNVRLGINAPKEIAVIRSELKKIEDENKNAASAVSPVMLAKLLKNKQEN